MCDRTCHDHLVGSRTFDSSYIHNLYNTTMHDKNDSIHDQYDTSEDENTTKIETYEHNWERIHETEESKPTETSLVLTVFNKAIHHEDDSSDDKAVIEIKQPKDIGKQEIGKQNKLLTMKFQIKTESRRAHNLFNRATNYQFKVNSGNNQDLWGVNTDFSSSELKWTIDAIFQHVGFYPTTENPCIMMRVSQITNSCEYIIIYHDELYIRSTTLKKLFTLQRTNTKSRSIHMFIKNLISHMC